jgi:hypothetical protein
LTAKTLKEKFEEIILDGRDRSNVLVSSLLDIGADGEYFNANTRKSFEWFNKGAASVVVELPTVAAKFEGGDLVLNMEPEAVIAAIEAAGGKVRHEV